MSAQPHYVIVVHGIGEQRKNETTLKVIERFASARHLNELKDRWQSETDPGTKARLAAHYHDAVTRLEAGQSLEVVTLGRASGATGIKKQFSGPLQWIEFAGIPKDPNPSNAIKGPFLGERTDSQNGTNFRFVDVCWSDILDDDETAVVQNILPWAQGLLGRLVRKNQVPQWIQKLLLLLIQSLLMTQQVMKLRFSSLEKLIFSSFLGDVQQYGEYTRARGRGTFRFHKLLGSIEAEHRDQPDDQKPRYTIIAHSLGTIMSFDALIYAKIRASIPELAAKVADDFRGYNEAADREVSESSTATGADLTNTQWIHRVDHFFTLGSPIDKYLIMWWQNYTYLTGKNWPTDIADSQHRIKHINYCDELDPVGHNLDVARSSAAYPHVFESGEDIVFNRYDIPGVAHTDYWNDQPLFSRILRTIDGQCPTVAGDPPATVSNPEQALAADTDFFFDADKIKNSINQIYRIIPLTIVLLEFVTLSAALNATSAFSLVLGSVCLALTICFGRGVIDLSLWWRRILIEKGTKSGACTHRSPLEANKWQRHQLAAASFKQSATLFTVSYVLGTAIFVGIYTYFWKFSLPYSVAHLASIAAIAGCTAYVFNRTSTSSLVRFENGGDHLHGAANIRRTAKNRLIADAKAWAIAVGACLVGSLSVWLPSATSMNPDAGAPVDRWGISILRSHEANQVLFHLAALFFILIVVFCYRNFRFFQIRDIAESYADRDTTLNFETYAAEAAPENPQASA